MDKIANVAEMKRGEAVNFNYQGKNAVLLKIDNDRFVAYSMICPHAGGNILWKSEINKLICECHLTLFNPEDGSVFMQSSILKKIDDLTPIELKVDDQQNAYAI